MRKAYLNHSISTYLCLGFCRCSACSIDFINIVIVQCIYLKMAAAFRIKHAFRLGRSFSRLLNRNLQEKSVHSQCQRLPGLSFIFIVSNEYFYFYILHIIEYILFYRFILFFYKFVFLSPFSQLYFIDAK